MQDLAVTVKFDRDYQVVFGTRTLALIEEAFKKSLYELAMQFVGGEGDVPEDATDAQKLEALQKRMAKAIKEYRVTDVLRFVKAVIPDLAGDPSVGQLASAWPVLLSAFVETFNRLFGAPEDAAEKKRAPSEPSARGLTSSSGSTEPASNV